MITSIRQYLGWRNWAVLTHNSVIENIFLLFYIALKDQLITISFVINLILFLLFSIFSTTYGYLINDLSDRELDKIHGKNNTFEDDSKAKALLIVMLFLTISIIIGSRFVGNPLFVIFWICWGLAATFYSLRPFRLKERGKTGLIVVVIAQRVLPTLLIFSAFRHYDLIDIVVCSSYIFFRGLSSDLNHQLSDYQNDSKTKTKTYAVGAGEEKTLKTFQYSLKIERFLLLVCLSTMSINAPNVRIYGLSSMIPMLSLYVLCMAKIIYLKEHNDSNPFVVGRKDIFQFVHHAFPSVLLPFYILLILVYEKLLFLPVLILFGLLRNMYSLETIKNSYPVKRIIESVK